jgi:hypothetical protein
MIKGTAPMRLKLEFDGTSEELVNIAEELAREDGDAFGLDSHDLGDAMGCFITHAMYSDSEFEIVREGRTLKCWIEYENFEWEGIEG